MTIRCYGPPHAGLFWAASCSRAHGDWPSFDPQINLQLGDVKVVRRSGLPSYMSLHLKTSKTDYQNKGTTLFIGCSANAVCAVCAIAQYKSLKRSVPESDSSFTFKSGQVLTKVMFVRHSREFLSICGIEQACFSGHSFRSGSATDGTLSGLADWEVKLAGLWTSEAYHRYVRAPTSALVRFASRMIRHRR